MRIGQSRPNLAGVASEVSGQLDRSAQAAKGMVAALVGLRSQGVTDRAVYDAVIRTTLEQNPQLLGTWSGWEPNALDGVDAQFVDAPAHDATGRYVPYWNRGSGEIAVEALIDYDVPGAGSYYLLPKTENRPVTIDPYVYAIAGKDTLIMSFGLPIVVDGQHMGTGGISLPMLRQSSKPCWLPQGPRTR